MDFLTNINWSQPSWDLFIVLLFVVSAFLYGLSLGRDRILVILTSIYMALAIINTAPYMEGFDISVQINNGSVLKVSVFLGMFAVIFFLVSRSAIARTFGGTSYGSWWHAIVFSFFHTGLMLSIVMQYLPKEILDNISEPMRQYFMADPARFFWLVAPIISMVLVGDDKDQVNK
ncbi:hypothetical protein IT409_03085 [Candidatus Falkowbacteria bacterium]|nr:hypothetical protein [Candidatus Falkowbacteria bacterium]